ncbi:kinase domain protein [Ceratobasidium sp. AG-Ba]|nr:kinase domain protein [Ceratobasidium sp. AG-Ba]
MRADSPTKSRSTHTFEYHSNLVGVARATLLADVPKVPEAQLDSLLSAVLSHVQEDADFERLCDTLSRESIVDGRWWSAPEPSQQRKLKGTEAFGFLSEVFDRVISLSEPRPSLLKCTIAGNTTPLSQRNNTSRPDGYVRLAVKSFLDAKTDSWADIVMPMEFKKSSDKQSEGDDFAKIVWSMHHTMRNDPRRRFVFGLTIEATTARLWFNDRAGVVASTPFDIHKNWRSFVRITLGIIRADKVQLGYDPDFELVDASVHPPRYDITVRSPGKLKAVYRTVKVLSEIGADNLIGRGTRVWEVQKLDSNNKPSGPHYALKDVWVHGDRPIEHETIRKITGEFPAYSKYFLTVLDAGFVPADVNDPSQPDDTAKTIRGGFLFILTTVVLYPRMAKQQQPEGTESETSLTRSSRKSAGSAQYTPTLPKQGHWDPKNVNRFPRRHYRIVFEEIGGSEGIHAIHMSGHVHRDISSGNILLVPGRGNEGARGVVIDLEYIKKISSDSDSHDVKTGTYEFIAIEVTQSSYVHVPDEGCKFATPPFRQNPLHDLESVWWICVWLGFRLVRPDEQPTSRYLTRYWNVFESHGHRNAFWSYITKFMELTQHFSEKEIPVALNDWRVELKKIYAQSYSIGCFVKMNSGLLDKARDAQKTALIKISEATINCPPGLKHLPELRPLPQTAPEEPGQHGQDDDNL